MPIVKAIWDAQVVYYLQNIPEGKISVRRGEIAGIKVQYQRSREQSWASVQEIDPVQSFSSEYS